MLLIPDEVEAIRQNRVGIVFVTSGEERLPELMMTLLRRWRELEDLDTHEPRPFVRFLARRGPLLREYRQFRF
jgi:hypothetical protein